MTMTETLDLQPAKDALSENEKWIFFANKSLGTVHMLPVFSPKKVDFM